MPPLSSSTNGHRITTKRKAKYATAAFFAGLSGKRIAWSNGEHFVHIPLLWLSACAYLGNPALRTAHLLWYFHTIHSRIPRLSYAKLARLLPLHMSQRTLMYGITSLRKAGLIRTQQRNGRAMRIEVIPDGGDAAALEALYWKRVDPISARAHETAFAVWCQDTSRDEWHVTRSNSRFG